MEENREANNIIIDVRMVSTTLISFGLFRLKYGRWVFNSASRLILPADKVELKAITLCSLI